VFAGAIGSISGDPQPGDVVTVHGDDGRFIAHGLFNPHSNLRVRLYSWDESRPLDDSLWEERITQAAALRQKLINPVLHTGCRLIYSEADGLSGLTVDRYADWLLVQITSLALYERRERLLDLLEERCHPRGIWLRTEKGMRSVEGLEAQDGLVRGESPPRPLFILENGLNWQVDVTEGQKTGGFLDQRDNRRAVAELVSGQRVLDLFCYAGGFGVTAAKLGNAAAVVCVDSSQPALDLAAANAEANGVADQIDPVRSDGFRYLEEARSRGEFFDTVVLDPPKMARSQSGLASAMRGYRSLNELAVGILPAGGTLVTCSCSGHVSSEDFRRMLSEVATSTGRRIQILEARGQAADHPVSPNCPENAYLKCLICRVV